MKFDPQRSSGQPSNAQSAKIVFSVYNRHFGGNINERERVFVWLSGLFAAECALRACLSVINNSIINLIHCIIIQVSHSERPDACTIYLSHY